MFTYVCGSIENQYPFTMFVCVCVGSLIVMLYVKLFLVLAIISLEEADCFTILSPC